MWIGWALLGLLALVLAVALAWVASNWRDAEVQPVPAALALPPPPQSNEGGLLAQMAGAAEVQPSFAWPDCKGSDCRQALEAKTDEALRWREANAALGEACEAALLPEQLRLGEALPTRWTVDAPLPTYAPLTRCHQWQLLRAWRAGQAGDASAMLAALRQAHRLERTVREQSQLLIGQMVGASMGGRKLGVLAALATVAPGSRAALAEQAELPEAELLAAMRRWVPAEAAFGRGLTTALAQGDWSAYGMTKDAPGWWDRLNARFTQPNTTQQLFDAHWLRVLQCLEGAHLAAAADCTNKPPEPGPLPGGLRWRHTVPYILHDVAMPAWHSYLDRVVDLHQAAQATQAWLRGLGPTGAVSVGEDGAWTLQLRSPRQSVRAPTHWAPLPPA